MKTHLINFFISMQLKENTTFDERYELKEFKGSGSFGEVWLARDIQTDVDVAIKIYIAMDQRGVEDFKKEFQVSFELNHTNLLHANYLEISKVENRPYLVMPFCPHGSVSKLQGKITELQAWTFLRDVARGLEYLHNQEPPIVHQDIKPENILISKSGDYVITDFGISHRVRDNMRKATAHLNSAGAAAYMGPERYDTAYSSMTASDIWSLGVTLYELVVGELPFNGMGGYLLKNGADYPGLPQEFSKDLNQTMKACLALEPWDRPSAEELADFATCKVKGKECKVKWLKEEDERQTETTQEKELSKDNEKVVKEDESKADVNKRTGTGQTPTGTSITDKTNSRIEIPEGSVKINVPTKSKKTLIIVAASLVGIILVGCIIGFVIHNNKVAEDEAKEKTRIELQNYNDSIALIVNSMQADAALMKVRGDDVTADQRDTCYLKSYNYAKEAFLTLKKYSGSDSNVFKIEAILNKMIQEVKDSLLEYKRHLEVQKLNIENAFENKVFDEYEFNQIHNPLKMRIQKCEDAIYDSEL